jgi:hypothetical protein
MTGPAKADRRELLAPLLLIGLYLVFSVAVFWQSQPLFFWSSRGGSTQFYFTVAAFICALGAGLAIRARSHALGMTLALLLGAGCLLGVLGALVGNSVILVVGIALFLIKATATVLALAVAIQMEDRPARAMAVGLVLTQWGVVSTALALVDILTETSNAPAGGREQISAVMGAVGLIGVIFYCLSTRSRRAKLTEKARPQTEGLLARGWSVGRSLATDRVRSRLLLARILAGSIAAVVIGLTMTLHSVSVFEGGNWTRTAWTLFPAVGLLAGATLSAFQAGAALARSVAITTTVVVPLLILAFLSTSDTAVIIFLSLAAGVTSMSLAPTYLLTAEQTAPEDRAEAMSPTYGALDLLPQLLAPGALLAMVAIWILGAQGSSIDTGFPGLIELTFNNGGGSNSSSWATLIPLRVGLNAGDPAAAHSLLMLVGSVMSLLLLLPASLFRNVAAELAKAPAAATGVPGGEPCQGCGAALAVDARFCGACGAPVAEAPKREAREAERGLPGRLAPWLATVAGVVALTVLVGQVQAFGLFDPGYSEKIVWKEPTAATQPLHDCGSNLTCLTGVMKANGGAGAAVKFSTDYATFQTDAGAGYVSRFHELGRVDVAEFYSPLDGQSGTVRVVMLDKHRMIAAMSPQDVDKVYRGDPATAEIWSVFPQALVFSEQQFVSASKLPDGGQRIVLASIVLDGCHACDVIGNPQTAYDFNRKGELVSHKVLPGDDKSDWRVSIKKKRDLLAAAAQVEAQMRAATEEQAFNNSLVQYDQMIAFDPTNPVAYKSRCWARAEAGRQLDAALADCDRALQLKPDYALALDNRGLVHLRRGEWAAALADFDLTLRLDATQTGSLYGRGLAKIRLGQTAAGQADMAAATNRNSDIAARFQVWDLAP